MIIKNRRKNIKVQDFGDTNTHAKDFDELENSILYENQSLI